MSAATISSITGTLSGRSRTHQATARRAVADAPSAQKRRRNPSAHAHADVRAVAVAVAKILRAQLVSATGRRARVGVASGLEPPLPGEAEARCRTLAHELRRDAFRECEREQRLAAGDPAPDRERRRRPSFIDTGAGEWSLATKSIEPAASSARRSSRLLGVRIGGAHFATAPMRSRRPRRRNEVVGARLAGDVDAARARPRPRADPVPVETWTTWSEQPVPRRARSRARSPPSRRRRPVGEVVAPAWSPPRRCSVSAALSAWTATAGPSRARLRHPSSSVTSSTPRSRRSPLGAMNALKPDDSQLGELRQPLDVPGTSPPQSAKSATARLGRRELRRTLAASTVGGCAFSGMSKSGRAAGGARRGPGGPALPVGAAGLVEVDVRVDRRREGRAAPWRRRSVPPAELGAGRDDPPVVDGDVERLAAADQEVDVGHPDILPQCPSRRCRLIPGREHQAMQGRRERP